MECDICNGIDPDCANCELIQQHQEENIMTGYDQPLTPVGTPVKITGGGLWTGSTGTIAKAYRIRHGHPMYDVELAGGSISSYHGQDQFEVLSPAREVIRTALVANPRSVNQVKDAVRTLNRKLAKLISWRGIPTTLYTLTATLEDDVIAIRLAEPDRSLRGLPAKVWAEEFLDVNQSAVSLYRHGKVVYHVGTTAAITAHLAEHPLTPK